MLEHIKNTSDTIEPSILVILGVTGDLARKKILPSLWYLYIEGRLPERVRIIGIARSEMDEAKWREYVDTVVSNRKEAEQNKEHFAAFCDLFVYQSGDVGDGATFDTLLGEINRVEEEWGVCTNKLFYLSVPPSVYETIFSGLARVRLNEPCGGELGWSRILIEKPIGIDCESARALEKTLASYFTDEQIYRIDHYFFKEIIQGIENFRFSNNLFEHKWDNTSIERIDIRLCESIGVGNRGAFYDATGALRDVGQNHMLAMLAAITMEYPHELSPAVVQDKRAAMLETLAPWTAETLTHNTYRAQYAGYREIKSVADNSQTETYFALQTELQHPRWAGVPIYFESGKELGEARKEMVLTLKHPERCHLCELGSHGPNRVVFRLEPNDEIKIHFWDKKPGFEDELEERELSFFLYEKKVKVQYVEEYAKALDAALRGNRRYFVSGREVEALWEFIDPIVQSWQCGTPELVRYEPGTKPTPDFLCLSPNEAEHHAASAGTLGVIGLGKMGGNIARSLHEKGWRVVGYNKEQEAAAELAAEGLAVTYSLSDLVAALPTPRTVWLMVPHAAVDIVLEELVPLLAEGDLVIDGGNSFFKDSVRRAQELSEHGIDFLDVGVSGGPDGARNGACCMVGGERTVYERCKRLFADLSVVNGYGYMGTHGAGHFVKMVHNGIEYGMMQAIGEGFAVLRGSPYELDLATIARVYNHGSVIESRLVSWLVDAYATYGTALDKEECCSGSVGHSGEGAWTVETARELSVPVAVIEGALQFRKQSQDDPSYTGQVVSALRHEFGGHDTSRE